MKKYEIKAFVWYAAVYFLSVLTLLHTREASGAVPAEPSIRTDLQNLFDNPSVVDGYPFQKELASAAEKYKLPLLYVLAVARGESFFNPRARSAKGALGIMQVMPDTAGEYGVRPDELLEPLTNIDVGVHFLADLYNRLEDPYLALAAYYCGCGGVDKKDLTVRKDCDDYVRYIHTHLQTILKRGEPLQIQSGGAVTFVVARFDNFLDSKRLLAFLSQKLADVEFDLFRKEIIFETHGRYQYQVMATAKTKEAQVCQKIRDVTGFVFCEE